MKQIFLDYISKLNYFLLAMDDDENADFYINDAVCLGKLLHEMKARFDTFGPNTKQRTLDAIEFISSSENIEKYWGYIVPQEVPLDEVSDKSLYLQEIYNKLTGRNLPTCLEIGKFELINAIDEHGIDIRN